MSKPDSSIFANSFSKKSVNIHPITLIYGPMFAGKTQELLSKLSRHEAIGQKVLLICSEKDKRNNLINVNSCTTHRKNPSTLENITELKVFKLSEIDSFYIETHDVIGIDEGQFFEDLILVKNWLIEKNKIIYVSGLMATSEGKLFGKMHKLIPFSKLINLVAFCEICHKKYKIMNEATMTTCLVEKNSDELIGSADYIPTCFSHWKEYNY